MKESDLSHIPARHEAIHARLEEWARWLRSGGKGFFCQPMFRMYQSKARHWDLQPHIHIEINSIAALEIERAVSKLPEKHKAALRFFYVWPWTPIKKIQRELALTHDALAQMVMDGRSMLANVVRK